MKVLLISTYELGHQPFGLASPAAWLKAGGAEVLSLDLAVQPFSEELVLAAELVAFYLPMHTATRLAIKLIPRVKSLNPSVHICCYGLYAPSNESFLRRLGVDTILGGEFESALLSLYRRLAEGGAESDSQLKPQVYLGRQQFLVPDRGGLPDLSQYAWLEMGDGERRLVGYTEATRGCKYLCRHCPIVPVYGGRFRVVQREVVLEDIRQQVAAGAQHITFGDPDFLNGPGHALPLVEALHAEFPDLTYDVTIKVEHLLKHSDHLSTLRDTGCLFVTSAVEAVDDRILQYLEKGHTRRDFITAVDLMRQLGIPLNLTFVAFNPWMTRRGYAEMLALIAELELIDQVTPIQYAIRLLLPAGSRLLELPSVKSLVGPYDESALAYPWIHPDPTMDELYTTVFKLVQEAQMGGWSREALFDRLWQAAHAGDVGIQHKRLQALSRSQTAAPIPHLSESWY